MSSSVTMDTVLAVGEDGAYRVSRRTVHIDGEADVDAHAIPARTIAALASVPAQVTRATVRP
jgi:hypothetical protein